MDIVQNFSGLPTEELFGLAQRENNSKRLNLLVNRFQAKHVPCDPVKSLALFDALAEQIKITDDSDSVLVIGFAETATAIGAQVAVKLGAKYYIHTTREPFPENYLCADFSEEHSHASSQRLYSDIKDIFDGIRHIIFVDDELTTGKTIINFIKALSGKVAADMKYHAVCIVNGQNAENSRIFSDMGIDVAYLVKIEDTLTDMNTPIDFIKEQPVTSIPVNKGYELIEIRCQRDARLGIKPDEYISFCQEAAGCVEKYITPGTKVDVIGTEEFMFPAIFAAARLQKNGVQVTCHSTTRSPIVPGKGNYPLHRRYDLTSLYEKDRRTFIYDLSPCDTAVVMCDSRDIPPESFDLLMSSIDAKKILLVRVLY